MNNEVQTIHEYIRLEAYLLSERAGHPAGMDHIFWTQAEGIVHGRSAVVSGTGDATVSKSKAKAVKAKPAPAAKPTAKVPKPAAARKTAAKSTSAAPAAVPPKTKGATARKRAE